MPASPERKALKAANQKVAINYRAKGFSVEDIARQMGITSNTIFRWVRDEPLFARQFRAAQGMALQAGEVDSPALKLGKLPVSKFAAFRKAYFGFDTYSHQLAIVDAIENMNPRDIAMVLLWPEAGKTTTLEDWICWKLALEPNHRITYVSESINHARKVAGRVKSRMTDIRSNPLYISKYGPFYVKGQEKEQKPWTADHFTVYKADHDERDFSFEARAWSSHAYGTRIDTCIIDDVQSRTGLVSTDNIMSNLQQTYFTRGKEMRIIIIGTRIDVGDVYETILKEDLVETKKLVMLRAMGEDGEPTVPEMWGVKSRKNEDEWYFTPKEHLAKIRKQVTEPVFWSSYQQNPMRNTLATFTAQMIEKAKDGKRRARREDSSEYVVLSLDPALGGGNALMALSFFHDKLVIMDLDVERDLSKVEQILNKIESFAIQYRPVEVIIEQAAFQKALVYDDRLAEMGRAYGFNVIPHTTNQNKADAVLGVASMAGDFMRGAVHIPWGDDYVQTRMEHLCNQLLAWRPNVPTKLIVQDTVMALWFAWRRWKDFTRTTLDNTDWTRQSFPWQPIQIHSDIHGIQSIGRRN